jgi:hypothetical protein
MWRCLSRMKCSVLALAQLMAWISSTARNVFSLPWTTSCNVELRHLSVTWHLSRRKKTLNMLHSKGCFLVWNDIQKWVLCALFKLMPTWIGLIKKLILLSFMVQNRNDSLVKLRIVQYLIFLNQIVTCNASHILCHWSNSHLQLLPVF